MKSDFSEVLIPTTGKMIIKEASNHSILKAFLASAFIIAFGLTILRYENKLAELDQRLAVLEIHSIQQEDKVNIKHRNSVFKKVKYLSASDYEIVMQIQKFK